MFPRGGSWCHRCCLHSSSLCFGGNHWSCWQRVLFCQGALFFSPRATSPTSAPHGFWPQRRGPSLCLARAIAAIHHQHHLPLSPFPHFISLPRSVFLSLLRPVPTQTDSINPTCDLCSTLTSRGTHKKKRVVFFI